MLGYTHPLWGLDPPGQTPLPLGRHPYLIYLYLLFQVLMRLKPGIECATQCVTDALTV